jgi:hypothetical protein
MPRRDSFDDGHGMDHHRAIRKAVRLGTGAVVGASLIGGPVGALAGAAAWHVMDKIYDGKRSEDEEDEL